jgi:LMBR1 domain-containing protein 1
MPAGWILFLIFAGVGVFGAPVDWIFEFLGRPKTTITKSEYMRRGRMIAQRAKEMVVSARGGTCTTSSSNSNSGQEGQR